jgi:hypothetical protein
MSQCDDEHAKSSSIATQLTAHLRVRQAQSGALTIGLRGPVAMYAVSKQLVCRSHSQLAGHRFDNDTPIEETVVQSLDAFMSVLTCCADAGPSRRSAGRICSLYRHEFLLGLAM